ncbi:MAG: methyltransferase domain-containing protein [Methyloligellaceae bacterium]
MVGDPELIEQYAHIHASRVYGATSVKNLRFLRPEIRLRRPRSILDYGCGQSRLLDELDLGYPVILHRYDPAIPDYAKKPEGAVDLLLNIDVLEHIEEEDLDRVLAEMRAACRDAIIIVDTRPASAILPDGRNAHVTLRPPAWWRDKLAEVFGSLEPVRTVRRSRAGFKTWRRGSAETLRYHAMRALEDASHYAGRVARLGRRGD